VATRPSHGELLRQKIAFGLRPLASTTTAFWGDARLPDLFPQFLIAIYGSARATVPLMETACRVSRSLSDRDPVAAALPAYFERHIAEETGHDEWLLQDLERLGFSREQVCDGAAHPAIVSMIGAQYYWILHTHPVSLLGLFAVLEGLPPTHDDLDDIQARTRLDAAAFRMLRHHAEADQRHADDLFAFIDRLPLMPRHAGMLGVSALHSILSLQSLFASLLDADTPAAVATA
jgi:hypothetical protein